MTVRRPVAAASAALLLLVLAGCTSGPSSGPEVSLPPSSPAPTLSVRPTPSPSTVLSTFPHSGATFELPTGWMVYPFPEYASLFTHWGYVSTEAMTFPCPKHPPPGGNAFGCRDSMKRLRPGGILMDWARQTNPGGRASTGAFDSVGGNAATIREIKARPWCRKLGGAEESFVVVWESPARESGRVPRGTSNTTIHSCLAEPLAVPEAQLDAVLASFRGPWRGVG